MGDSATKPSILGLITWPFVFGAVGGVFTLGLLIFSIGSNWGAQNYAIKELQEGFSSIRMVIDRNHADLVTTIDERAKHRDADFASMQAKLDELKNQEAEQSRRIYDLENRVSGVDSRVNVLVNQGNASHQGR